MQRGENRKKKGKWAKRGGELGKILISHFVLNGLNTLCMSIIITEYIGKKFHSLNFI